MYGLKHGIKTDCQNPGDPGKRGEGRCARPRPRARQGELARGARRGPRGMRSAAAARRRHLHPRGARRISPQGGRDIRSAAKPPTAVQRKAAGPPTAARARRQPGRGASRWIAAQRQEKAAWAMRLPATVFQTFSKSPNSLLCSQVQFFVCSRPTQEAGTHKRIGTSKF